jgi:hypothetical protein
MPSVAPDGKIIPDPVETPADAKQPPVEMKGGPIVAAADKTAAATAEASEAVAVMANPAGMSGGAQVEVNPPGAKMPSGGSGPSFAGNFMSAVETLDKLQTNAAADSLAKPGTQAQQLDPASTQDGGAKLSVPFEPEGPVYAGLRPAHTRFHAKELAKGVKMEMEHTDSPRIALEIAKDHLLEVPDYYTRLEAMTKTAKAHHKKKGRKTKRNGRRDKRTHRRSDRK